jgi:uncharacterized membrane-anchored protein
VNRNAAGKVPEATLAFWISKILVTTLGETGGDAVTMSMHAGHLVGAASFGVLFRLAVAVQMEARQFHPIPTGWRWPARPRPAPRWRISPIVR